MHAAADSGAARAGMENLTKTLAFEWAPKGVRVNAVAPGWIASSGMDTYGGAFRAIIPMLKQNLPAQRMGSEAEVSAAVAFLLSPGAAHFLGVIISIDTHIGDVAFSSGSVTLTTSPSCPPAAIVFETQMGMVDRGAECAPRPRRP